MVCAARQGIDNQRQGNLAARRISVPSTRSVALGLVAALASVGPAEPAAADSVFFDIDPTRSVVHAEASLELPNYGVTIPTLPQGEHATGIPGFSTGTSGQLDGYIVSNIDWNAQSMVFGGGGVIGLPSGQWEPGLGGLPGVEPAIFGVLIQDLFGIPARAVAAVRDFRFDYRDAYAITNLTPQVAGQYQFQTDEWLAVSAKVDAQGQSGLAAFLGSQRFDLSERFGARNAGQIGTLTPTPGGEWEIRIPIDISIYLENEDNTPVGPINVAFHVEGQIVGTSVAPPVPGPSGQALPGNDTRQTAQGVDDLFTQGFDVHFGDALVNTSLAYPHATIEAVGDGTFDFFRFTVNQSGSTGFFDIDGATFDSELFLFDAFGNLLASNDDAPSSMGGAGSSRSLDAFIEYTFARAGEYTIGVGQFDSFALGGLLVGSAPPAGSTYTLRLSVVPEASTGVLTLMGAGAGGWLVRLARKRRRRREPPRLPGRCPGGLGAWALLCGLAIGCVAQPAVANPLIKPSLEAIYDSTSPFPVPYRLFQPTGLEGPGPSDERFPLVLFLHGAGERGTNNWDQVAYNIDGLIRATQGSTYSAFLLAPQVTDFPYGGGWNPDSPFDRTKEILDQVVREYPVDPNRIYLTGLSMGGFGTFRYLEEFPDLFAAAVPLAGGGNTNNVSLYADVPMWVFHGTLDDVVSVQNSRRMVAALTAAGGSPLYTELPNGRHDIWPTVYGDAATGQFGLYDWMFSQSRAPVVPVPELSSSVLGLIVAACIGARGARRRLCRGALRPGSGQRRRSSMPPAARLPAPAGGKLAPNSLPPAD